MKNALILGTLILTTLAAPSQAGVIGGVTVTDSTGETGWGAAANIVNNNGFIQSTGWHFNQRGYDKNGNSAFDEGVDYGYHWFTKSLTPLPTLEFDLGPNVTSLNSIKVWNLNWTGYTASGVAAMDIIVVDRYATEFNLGEFVLSQAPGTFGSDFGQVIDITDIADARYVRFNMKGMFFGFDRCGLSEVQFDGDYFGAGPDQTVEMTGTSIVVNLDGNAGASSVTWSVADSPAGSTVIFGNPDVQDTTATLDWPGTYALQLTNNDSGTTDTVTIQVNKVVTVGPDQYVTLASGSAATNLDGTCTTDVTWSVESGPAAVAFTPNADAQDPTATFTVAGTYVLRMTDDLFGLYDPMKVTVFMEPLPPGLIGHWPLDGTADDSSIYNNHGTVHGNPQYVAGKVGQAMSFDGDGDGVEIPHEEYFESASGDMTVSFWVKIPYGARPQGNIVGKNVFSLTSPSVAGISEGWCFINDPLKPSENVIFYIRADSRVNLFHYYFDTLNNGKWHHIAGTYDGVTKTAKYYMDGVFFKSGITAAQLGANDTPLTFGYLKSRQGLWDWEGVLDEVRFYNYALTDAQIEAEFLADGGTRCSAALECDLNADCQVDMTDLLIFMTEWLHCVNYYPNECP